MKTIYQILTIALLSIISIIAVGQTEQSHQYVSIALIKSKSSRFESFEKEVWVPVHRQLIKSGRKVAWYLYKVKYPDGEALEYDYVRFNVFTDWKQLEAPYAGLDNIFKAVHPALDAKETYVRTEDNREIVQEQVLQLVDQAANSINNPSKYIIVNEMKPVEGQERQYVGFERTYFKPFHVERVKAGVMNNWELYRRALPYGEKFDYDYVTYNGFQNWEDIMRNPPAGTWQKVHGDVDFNLIHDQILAKRITVNNELWELVAFAVE